MPAASPVVSGVVFDIGGVLIDWDPRHLYCKLFDDPEEEEMEWFLTEVCSTAWNLEQDRGRPWSEAVALLCERFPERADLIRAYDTRWPEMVSGAIHGTPEILAELRFKRVPVYAITNFAADKLELAIETYPFLGEFDGIVVSGSVGLVKPDERIYRRLLDDHGLAAADLVFIDDKPENVAAARTVGMHGIVFTDALRLRAELIALGLPLDPLA